MRKLMAVRVHPWVLWWFYVGVACGVVAVANILFRDLTRTQERWILALGVVHWALGGLVCWATEGIQIERRMSHEHAAENELIRAEWHDTAEVLDPMERQMWRRSPWRPREVSVAAYIHRHKEQQTVGMSAH